MINKRLLICCYIMFFSSLNTQSQEVPVDPEDFDSEVVEKNDASEQKTEGSGLKTENIEHENVSDLPVEDGRQPKEEQVDIPVAENTSLSEEKIGVQGNWVKKREWVKEAYKVNEKIQDLVLEIQNLREPYQTKFRKIDEELDSFYEKQGFKQANVKSLFKDISRYLDKKNKKQLKKIKKGVTSDEKIKINILLKDIENLKSEIEQLRFDVRSISKLDSSLKDRLKKLDQYINQALQVSGQSKDLLDEIWYVIDDLKARDIYYKLEGTYLEKAKALNNYLTKDFVSDFDSFLQLIRKQFEQISSKIEELEKKGLIIKNRTQRLDEIKLKDLENKNYNQTDKDEEEKDLNNEDESLDEKSFVQKIYNFFVHVIAKIYNFIAID